MENTDNAQEHLLEPIRREVAARYVQHEMRKLLPTLRDASTWQQIDADIEGWYDVLSPKYFWNAIDGFSMGLRLYALVPWITSRNMRWERRDVPVDELHYGGERGMGALGAPAAAMVRQRIFLPEHDALRADRLRELEEIAAASAPRLHFPLFAVRKEGQLRVIDGNHRLLKAILERKEAVAAYVGEPVGDPPIFDEAPPLSLLVALVFRHKQAALAGRDTTEVTARMILELIRDSATAQARFRDTAVHPDDEHHMRLLQAVEAMLG